MTILLAFPSSAMSFFLIFVLLELDSDLSTYMKALFWMDVWREDVLTWDSAKKCPALCTAVVWEIERERKRETESEILREGESHSLIETSSNSRNVYIPNLKI